jgi:hypothetical protein
MPGDQIRKTAIRIVGDGAIEKLNFTGQGRDFKGRSAIGHES